jgi:hypothetical protein
MLMLLGATSHAATRTVSFRVQIKDQRTRCPTVVSSAVPRPCNPGGYVDFVGGVVELWDKDTGSPDDFIGSYLISGTGVRTATFDWEAINQWDAETNPDVYLRVYPEVGSQPSGNIYVRVKDASGTEYAPSIFDSPGFVYNDCPTGTTCAITAFITPTTDAASALGGAYQILDASQRVIQNYRSQMNAGTINVWYPLNNQPVSPFTSCATGLTWDAHNLCMPPGALGFEGDRSPHEMGHVLQMQLFGNQTGLRDDTSLNGSGWTMGSAAVDEEYDSAATTEGWASFVSTTAWYSPAVVGAGALVSYSGVLIEPAVPLVQGDWAGCQHQGKLPRNVAKAFWDYTDVENETGPVFAGASDDDICSVNALDESLNWTTFPPGTADRQRLETGSNGVNTLDYLWHLPAPLGACDPEVTLANHNCIQASEQW